MDFLLPAAAESARRMISPAKGVEVVTGFHPVERRFPGLPAAAGNATSGW
jgi:hypothetical protein